MEKHTPENRHELGIPLGELFSTPEFDVLEQESQSVSVSPCAARHGGAKPGPCGENGQSHILAH